MPSLKDLRTRIRSVQSTKKITAAMKVVAASRLKKAQDAAESARPYAQRMERMLGSLAASLIGQPHAPALLGGTGKDQTVLLIVATSDRGLAGGFNATILRDARRQIRALQAEGRQLVTFTPPGAAVGAGTTVSYDFEPEEAEILAELLPMNIIVQIFTVLLENTASEQGSRMTAMDNATRNAGRMIDRLTLNYNRTRQAYITKELIEIISGADAL